MEENTHTASSYTETESNSPTDKTASRSKNIFPIPPTYELAEEDKDLYEFLKIWRTKVARELQWSPAIVSTNNNLIHIATVKPTTIGELKQFRLPAKVKEIGGDAIIEIFAWHSRKQARLKQ